MSMKGWKENENCKKWREHDEPLIWIMVFEKIESQVPNKKS